MAHVQRADCAVCLDARAGHTLTHTKRTVIAACSDPEQVKHALKLPLQMAGAVATLDLERQSPFLSCLAD